MKIASMAAALVMLATPALAQITQEPPSLDTKPLSAVEIEEKRKAEEAYRKSLRSIPDKASNDPWGSVRSEPSTGAKSEPKAKPKAKKTDAKTEAAGQSGSVPK